MAALLLAYALLTGARPSALRAAVMVCLACHGVIRPRLVIPANVLAVAVLAVIGVNPTDPFAAGAQLSFSCGCSLWRVVGDDRTRSKTHGADGLLKWPSGSRIEPS